MLKRINNWHLSVLVAIVSIFSLAVIQQYAEAQWTDPGSLPGGTPANNLVVTPMTEALQLGGHDIADTNLRIDGNGADVIKILNNQRLCLGVDCRSVWPTVTAGGSGSLWDIHTGGIHYVSSTNPNVGIGTVVTDAKLRVQNSGTEDIFQLYDGSSEVLSVADGGSVNIGGGTDHSGFKLNINNGGNSSLKLDLGQVYAYTTDLNLQSDYDVYTASWFGIGTNAPQANLHIRAVNGKAKIESTSGDNAELKIQSPSASTATQWGIYQEAASRDLNFWHGIDGGAGGNKFTIESSGRVGIGTTDPTAYLEIAGNEPLGSVDLRLFNSTGQDSRIIFRGYTGTEDDFSIKWSGRNGVEPNYENWLEFWGRTATSNGRPVMTMQRDNVGGQFQGVGIGVAQGDQINTKLRVQNYGTEDILQLYDNTNKVLAVKDGGDLLINGDVALYHNNTGAYNYVQIDHLIGSLSVPPAADCDGTTATKGRMIYSYINNKLFICDDDDSWKSVVLN